MRTVSALVLLLFVVVAASLVADRSDVDSQGPTGSNRAYLPGVARLTLTMGPAIPIPHLQYTVIIQIEARDTEPEACCLDRNDTTQLQLVVSHVLPRGAREPGLAILQMTVPYESTGGTDMELCTWTRSFTETTHFWIGGTDGIFVGGSVPLVVVEVDGPEWFYKVVGCRGFTSGEPGHTEKRSLGDYMTEVFAGHLSLGANYLVFDTPLNPGYLLSCVTHFGEYSGQVPNVTASIKIFVYTDPCAIPQPPFPF